MPFDAMQATQVTVLNRLGLIPVPDAVLTAHKAQVQAEFHSNLKITQQQKSLARWYEFYPFNSQFLGAGRSAERGSVPGPYEPLAYLQQCFQSQGAGVGPTPAAVTDIVKTTEQRAHDAGIETERVVGFFYTDPYVCLVYREGDEVKRACLAIWDGDQVLHRATLSIQVG